jgi:hypothetical protein
MTPHEFDADLRRYALDRAVDVIIGALEKPSGRRAGWVLVHSSDWYRRLGKNERVKVRNLSPKLPNVWARVECR